MSQYRLIFTNIGLTKKQNAELNNNYIQIAKFAVGSGVITNLNPNMTGLLIEEYRADIHNVDTKNGTTIFDLIIPSEIGGFWIKEVALFDIDGDCICIGTVPITYKVNQDEGSSKAVHIKVSTTSTNTENIVFNTDDSLVYATVSYVNNHIQDKNNPHNVTKVQIGLENVANLTPKDLPLSDADINALALKINYTDVKNSLTATDTNKPLSAAQGKLLKQYIDNINTLLLSDTTSLDTLQEIVDFIELNRTTLETLGISSIAGLQNALNSKLGINAKAADSALLNGITASTSPGTNTIVKRDSNGYIEVNYIRTVIDEETTPATHYFYGNGTSGYIRKKSLVNVKNELLASAILTGTPTAPTAALVTNNTQIANTAFVKSLVGGSNAFAQSLSNNGYVKLASGLIIQWGNTPAETNSIFPIAFPNTVFRVLVQIDWNNSGNFSGWDIYPQDITNTGFNRPDQTAGCTYLAIGY
jgi:hypothetical protein